MNKINSWIDRNDRRVVCGLALFNVFLFYVTWCLSTISYQGTKWRLIHLLCTGLTLMVYIGWIILYQKKWRQEKITKQLRIVNGGLLFFFVILTWKDWSRGDRDFFLLVADLLWVICTEIVFVLLRRQKKEEVIKKWFQNNWMVLFFLGICMLLAVYPTMLQFKWDGALYEQACWIMDIHSMSSMAPYAHIAQGYGVLFCFFRMIHNDPDQAMALTNLAMYAMSVLAFYGIVKHIKKDAKQFELLFMTGIYAFSPLTLGMVNYYSLDYATVCFFVCMLYFMIKEQWVLQSVVAFFACFTKEPAIILYGGMCLGIVINRVWKDKSSWKERFVHVFCRPEYYVMVLTAILWYITYKMLGGWDAGAGGFATDENYVLAKNVVLFISNFTWIVLLILCAGFFSCMIQKKKEALQKVWIWAIVGGVFFMSIFQMLFKTVNHMRYAAIVPVLLYVIAVNVIGSMKQKRNQYGVLIVLGILFLISSFQTIDPISKVCLQTLDTGNGTMLTMGIPVPGDSMIYNKQMLYLEDAMNDAVEEAIASDCQIAMPAYEKVTNLFEGMMGEYTRDERKAVTTQYWDPVKRARTIYESEVTVPFTIVTVLDEKEAKNILFDGAAGHRCYIYSDLVGVEEADQILTECPDATMTQYTSHNWTIKALYY